MFTLFCMAIFGFTVIILGYIFIAICIPIGVIHTIFTGLVYVDWQKEVWTDAFPRSLRAMRENTENLLSLFKKRWEDLA